MRGDQDFRYDKDRKTLIPARTGYYWALWTKAANGTHEGDDLTPAVRWELVQVNDNNVDDPEDDEYLSVSVPGVRETQWRENFKWGLRVCDLAEGDKKPFSTNAQSVGRDIETIARDLYLFDRFGGLFDNADQLERQRRFWDKLPDGDNTIACDDRGHALEVDIRGKDYFRKLATIATGHSQEGSGA